MKDKIYFLAIFFMFFLISVFFGLILIKDYKITQAPFEIIEINRLTGKVRLKQIDIEEKFYQSELNKRHKWLPGLAEKIKMRKLTEQEEKEILRKCGVLYDLQYNQTGAFLLKEKNRFVRDCSVN